MVHGNFTETLFEDSHRRTTLALPLCESALSEIADGNGQRSEDRKEFDSIESTSQVGREAEARSSQINEAPRGRAQE